MTFRLVEREHFFPIRLWKRLPREAAQLASLEVFRTQMGIPLSNLVWAQS